MFLRSRTGSLIYFTALRPKASLAGRTAVRRKSASRWGEVPKSGFGTPTYPTS
jgi:hypothetical protein